MQSGSAFSTWGVNSRKNGRLMTTAFAVAASCYRRKIKSMVTCLQELSPAELVNTERRMTVLRQDISFFSVVLKLYSIFCITFRIDVEQRTITNFQTDG